MPAPQEIPGFYFDQEKNRYFPIKGPIPGRGPKRPPRPSAAASAEASTSSSCSYSSDPSSSSQHIKPRKGHLRSADYRRKGMRTTGLLQARELHGRLIPFNEGRFNFEQEYEKVKVSHPLVYKYQDTDLAADSALQQFHILVQTPEGIVESNVLSMGSMAGSVSLYQVGKFGKYCGYGLDSMPLPAWPPSMRGETMFNSVPGSLWSSHGAALWLSSSVSSILKIGKHSYDTNDRHNALVTTLGSGDVGGSVYVLNFHEVLDFRTDVLARRRTSKIASFDFTLWTATCNSSGTQAALGTNRGASLLNLETGRLSWLYHTKSDIFSQQFDQSGNVLLCGLRNGSVVAVDVRQKHLGSLEHSAASPRYPASNMVRQPQRMHVKKLKTASCKGVGAVDVSLLPARQSTAGSYKATCWRASSSVPCLHSSSFAQF